MSRFERAERGGNGRGYSGGGGDGRGYSSGGGRPVDPYIDRLVCVCSVFVISCRHSSEHSLFNSPYL